MLNVLKEFFGMAFSDNCVACGNFLPRHETLICTDCRIDLPIFKTNDAALKNKFLGKSKVENIFTLLSYQKLGKTQQLIHALKYFEHSEIGELLGKWLGILLVENNLHYDLIIPVPLHTKKLAIRGYNQADMIAKGISETMQTHYVTDILVRKQFNISQTKQNRWLRWQNVQEAFSVQNEKQLLNQSILLVDDVLTTGATIEACVNELFAHQPKNISVAVLAATI